MPIDLYLVAGSSPCHAVLLTAKAIGVDLNLKNIDLMKREQMTPEFLKMNPQHSVPTINDNGFCLGESRAILGYLVNQYGKNDSLYPKDPKKRALVDQRMYFDIGTLHAALDDYYYSVIFYNASYDPAKMKKIEEAFQFLDTFLATSEYVAGDCMTIADLCIVATVSIFEVLGFDITRYPKVVKWFATIKQKAPGYEEANTKNVIIFKEYIDGLMKNK